MSLRSSDVAAPDQLAPHEDESAPGGGNGQAVVVVAIFFGLVLTKDAWVPLVDSPPLRTWSTVFVAIVVQALPFLVLGVVLAGAISTFVSERALARVLPSRPSLAVPVAGVAGIGLIGCECASVPIAGSAVRKGVAPAVALTFLLAAPAVNPVVLVSTAVAFPGQPAMVVARFTASLATALVVGWLWLLLGHRAPAVVDRVRSAGGPGLPHGHAHGEESGWRGFLDSCQHDFMRTAGFLVVGAAVAAAVNTFVPKPVLEQIGSHALLGVLAMAVLAFVVALCSQTDAFVAASLTAFSPTARLVFLVVGPAMDVKLAIIEAGAFGRRFAQAFVPLVVVVAVVCGVVVGTVLL